MVFVDPYSGFFEHAAKVAELRYCTLNAIATRQFPQCKRDNDQTSVIRSSGIGSFPVNRKKT